MDGFVDRQVLTRQEMDRAAQNALDDVGGSLDELKARRVNRDFDLQDRLSWMVLSVAGWV